MTKRKKKPSKIGVTPVRAAVDSEKGGRRQINRRPPLIAWLVATAGAVGLLLNISDNFLLPLGSGLFWLIALCAAATALFCAVFTLKRAAVAVACLSATAFVGFLFRKSIAGGFAVFYNYCIAVINENFLTSFIELSLPEGDEERMLLIFLAACLVLLSAALAFFAAVRMSFTFSFAITFPIFEFGIYFGMEPGIHSFFIIMGFWIALLAMRLSFNVRRSKGEQFSESGKNEFAYVGVSRGVTAFAAVAVLVASAVALAVSVLALHAVGEPRPMAVRNFRSNVMAAIEDVRVELEELTIQLDNTTADGDINGGRLGSVDSLEFSGRDMLSVSMPLVDNVVYLKGFTGGVYTGDSWLPDENAEYAYMLDTMAAENSFYPQNLTGSALRYLSLYPSRSIVSVTNVGANSDFIYAPYGAIYPDDGSVEFIADSYVSPRGRREYELEFYPALRATDIYSIFSNWSSSTRAYEEVFYRYHYGESSGDSTFPDLNAMRLTNNSYLYEQYVYESYLELPENLYFLYDEAEVSVANSDSAEAKLILTMQALSEIENRLDEAAEYSLSPGRLPEGEDFVEYFLNESHSGYCSHFASAAVMMLRAAGIPARYAEGFAVSLPGAVIDGVTVYDIEVTDNCAHAWAEYYIGGYGWAVFDPTPGAEDREAGYSSAAETTATTSETTMEETAESAPPAETVYTETAPSGDVSYTVVEELAESEEPSPPMAVIRIAAAVALSAALVISVIILRRRARLCRRRREMSQSDRRNAVIACYEYFIALSEFAGVDAGNLHSGELSDLIESRFTFLAAGSVSDFFAVVLKAEFSREEITEAERSDCVEFVNGFAEQLLHGMNRMKKRRFIYIKCLR